MSVLRNTILTAIKTALEGIDGTSNYTNNVNTVEFAARSWDEPESSDAHRPWIGIIPLRERIESFPGHIEVFWEICLLAHLTPASPCTLQTMADACGSITSDIRQALYATPGLGVDNLIDVTLTARVGTEGSLEAVNQAVASVDHTIVVHFIEGFSDQ